MLTPGVVVVVVEVEQELNLYLLKLGFSVILEEVQT